jgi:hypothetical protein
MSSAALRSCDLGEQVRGGAERDDHAGVTLARCSPARARCFRFPTRLPNVRSSHCIGLRIIGLPASKWVELFFLAVLIPRYHMKWRSLIIAKAITTDLI